MSAGMHRHMWYWFNRLYDFLAIIYLLNVLEREFELRSELLERCGSVCLEIA